MLPCAGRRVNPPPRALFTPALFGHFQYNRCPVLPVRVAAQSLGAGDSCVQRRVTGLLTHTRPVTRRRIPPEFAYRSAAARDQHKYCRTVIPVSVH